MKTCLSRSALVLTLAATLTSASPVTAGLVVTFEEMGSDVVGTLSGAFAALPTPSGNFNAILQNRVAGGLPYFDATDQTPGSSVNVNSYDFVPVNSFPDFGTSGTVVNANTSTASTSVLLNAGLVGLPPSYTTGTPITGVLTWTGQSLASLALTPGSYVGTLSNNETFTINVVPEPSAYALGLASLGCCAAFLARRNRRQRSSHRL